MFRACCSREIGSLSHAGMGRPITSTWSASSSMTMRPFSDHEYHFGIADSRTRNLPAASPAVISPASPVWWRAIPSMYRMASGSSGSPFPFRRIFAPRMSRWKLPFRSNVTLSFFPAKRIQPVTLPGVVLSSSPSNQILCWSPCHDYTSSFVPCVARLA